MFAPRAQRCMDQGLHDWADVIASIQINGHPGGLTPGFLDLAEERACELVSRRNAAWIFLVLEAEARELVETFTTALRQAWHFLDELEDQRIARGRDVRRRLQ